LIAFVPAKAVIVPPPQEPTRLFGVAIIKPAGSVSVKATPVSETVAFGFVILKLNVVFPDNGMTASAKDFTITGGPMTTRVAVPVPETTVWFTVMFAVTLLT